MEKQDYIMQASLSSHAASQETKFPGTKISVPFAMSRETIFGIFEHFSTKLGFKIIDKGCFYMTSVHQSGFSLKRIICCFRQTLDEDRVTAIKISVENDESHWQKLIRIKGLSGVHSHHNTT